MKKLVSLLLAVAMLLSFAACGKGDDAPSTEPALTNALGEVIEVITDANGETVVVETDFFGNPIEATEAPEATAAPEETVASDATTVPGETTAPDATTVPGETTAPDATTVPGATTAPGATTVPGTTKAPGAATPSATKAPTTKAPTTKAPATPSVPSSPADIVALYNKAINSAYDAKAGFDKQRWVDNEKLDAGALITTFGDLVYSFMGIGAANKYTMNVTKGKWEPDVQHHYLRKSTLSAADVTSAKCQLIGNEYQVALDVKGGNSKADKNSKSTNAPIDKCGICVGDEDKSYYDHKTAAVIYSAIGGTFAGAKINESYSNAKVIAAIDASTGHITKLVVTYDISVALDVDVGKGTATGSSHVTYNNFKY